MKKIIMIWFLIYGSLFAGTITIAVAANVSYAMDDLKKAFQELHPEIKVRTILGSSGKLTAQIRNGAPYQLFMSANMKYPEALYTENKAADKPQVYAEGTLALFSVKAHDFSKGLALLREKKVKRIAVANPKTAPYGIAAEEALKHAKIYEAVKNKFIYGESVSQTVSYAVTAADMGIIAKSALFSKHMQKYQENIHWKEVDPKLYTPIAQGMVILKRAASNDEVKVFYDFILSAEARQILHRYGYKIP